MKEFKSFFKDVSSVNEGTKCRYTTRLDTYGCGCQHDCSYCYAKSLLNFRGLWDPGDPAIASADKIITKVRKMRRLPAVRLGGMTDCFQPIEKLHRVTYKTIQALNEKRQPYLIVTKSSMVADDEYVDLMDRNLAHIQVTMTCFSDDVYRKMDYEKASLPSQRAEAIQRLQEEGFDTQLRLSPLIPELFDVEAIGRIKCDKILVEFLRVNSWIQKWFNIDYSPFTVKEAGYRHLPLEVKKQYVEQLKPLFKELTVCEDESEAYEYWRDCVNPNKNDCCNLRVADAALF